MTAGHATARRLRIAGTYANVAYRCSCGQVTVGVDTVTGAAALLAVHRQHPGWSPFDCLAATRR